MDDNIKFLFRSKDEKEIRRIKEIVAEMDQLQAEYALLVGNAVDANQPRRGRPPKSENGQTEAMK